jgi:hypothetical protein
MSTSTSASASTSAASATPKPTLQIIRNILKFRADGLLEACADASVSRALLSLHRLLSDRAESSSTSTETLFAKGKKATSKPDSNAWVVILEDIKSACTNSTILRIMSETDKTEIEMDDTSPANKLIYLGRQLGRSSALQASVWCDIDRQLTLLRQEHPDKSSFLRAWYAIGFPRSLSYVQKMQPVARLVREFPRLRFYPTLYRLINFVTDFREYIRATGRGAYWKTLPEVEQVLDVSFLVVDTEIEWDEIKSSEACSDPDPFIGIDSEQIDSVLTGIEIDEDMLGEAESPAEDGAPAAGFEMLIGSDDQPI